MLRIFQEVFLSQWVVLVLLFLAFLFVSWWALNRLREFPGYALGWMIGLFFMLVYGSLGDPAADLSAADANLNLFQVILATFFGLVFGGMVLGGLRHGMRYARIVALQVAAYTGLNLVLLFLTVIEGPITQRMIGIFALAFGIATVFLLVLFPSHERHQEVSRFGAQSASDVPPQSPYTENGGSRLDQIRSKMGRPTKRP
jgi:hypothetical protein